MAGLAAVCPDVRSPASGAWDLEQQLPREAQLKQLTVPDVLRRFINLMDVFGPACRYVAVGALPCCQ